MTYLDFNASIKKSNDRLFIKYEGSQNCVPQRKIILDNHDSILLMGLNPAGEEDHEDFETFVDYIPSFDIKSPHTWEQIKKMTYNKYFKGNYELFSRINPKLHWINDDSQISSVRANISSIDHKAFDEMIENEKTKSQIILTFSDLFNIRQGKSKKVIDYLNQQDKDEVKKHLVDIMEQQISYYKPKMVVITNVVASNYIREYYLGEANICDTKEINGVTYVFSGMITGQRGLDRYSRLRLENSIFQNWFRQTF